MSGHLRKRKRKDGSTAWQVRWPENGKEVTRTFSLRREAQRWLADRQAASLRGDLISPEQQLLTVAELAAEWQATWPGRLEPGSQKRAEQLLRLYILPSLGMERAATLSYSRVSGFLASLPASMSPSTRRKVHACLSGVFTEGIRAGNVRVNPCRHQRLPRVPRQERLIVTLGEIDQIVAELPDEQSRLALRLAAYTGLRAGEQWALRWSDIADDRLIIRRALKLVGGQHEFGPTKTHQVRRVSIPGPLAGELDSRRNGDAEGLVFQGPQGAPIRQNLFVRRTFRPAVKRACPEKAGLRWHDLRHSHGSHLLSMGVPIHVVKERLGHASIQTTVDVYGHLMPGADDEVARLFENGSTPLTVERRSRLNGHAVSDLTQS